MNQKIFFILIFILFFIISCRNDNHSDASAASAVINEFPPLTYSLYASGFNTPVSITHAGDGSKRLFIVEKKGIVKIISNGSVLPGPFLDISNLVSNGSEQGLLGIAFPPHFETKRYFYIDYTNRIGIGNTVIARYPLTANPNVANSNAGTTLLTITQPFANHNGGEILFGPDGLLYIGTGDGGSGGDPFKNAQNTSSLLGKILRIDVESNQTHISSLMITLLKTKFGPMV